MELPVGYRFHPTKEELVNCYLKGRVRGHLHHQPCIIPDVDICSCDPWALPGIFHDKSIIGPDGQVRKWWFFSPHTPDTAQKVKRSTPSGYWKKTGDHKEVRAKETGTVIGKKKFLVFHQGRGKNGVKTNWVIHEYHLLGNDLDRTYVLCRLKLKRDKKADNSTNESERGAIITLADFELDSDHEYLFPEPSVQVYMNSLRELIQPENQLQPALGSQNNSFSGMDTSLDNEEDEDVGDLQNANLAHAQDILMNRQARTTDSVSGFVPVEEKKGVVENKFNGSPFASEKPMPHPETVAPHRPMAPPVRPASVKCYSKDEEQRFEKFKRETAVINIKPERISLDEAAARAKVQGYKERGSAGNSTKKTNSKKIEYAKQKSNSVAASTGTTSESTKTSTNSKKTNSKKIEYAKQKSNSVAASTGTTSKSTKTSTNSKKTNSKKIEYAKQKSNSVAASTGRTSESTKTSTNSKKTNKKTNSKKIEYAKQKSNSVAASTGTTSESTKTSTNTPLPNLVNALIGIFLLLTITRQVFNL